MRNGKVRATLSEQQYHNLANEPSHIHSYHVLCSSLIFHSLQAGKYLETSTPVSNLVKNCKVIGDRNAQTDTQKQHSPMYLQKNKSNQH